MKGKKMLILIVAAVLLTSVITYIVIAAVPGSGDDPLVTKSYVDNLINQRIAEAQANIINSSQVNSIVESKVTSMLTADKFGYKVMMYPKGTVLTGKEGAEFILRSGSAVCISPASSIGIYDYTSASFVTNGNSFATNHYYVFHRDGRSIKCETDCYLLIRGTFTTN